LIEYVKQESVLAQSRTMLNLSNKNKTLFQLLDANTDGRLSTREFRLAAEQIGNWDANGDGKIETTELPSGIQVDVGTGEPGWFAASRARLEGNAAQSQVQGATAEFSSRGPTWFARMDRNRDGDVSRREFLGPLEAFEKLDGDSDGFVTLDEAVPPK
jgi:hypothetical protein